MSCSVLAVGTELLLGHVVDTNGAWIGEQLAAAGIDCFERRTVGDNVARIEAALRSLLATAEAVVVCGGLGPTPDDVTREAVAAVMGVPLERHDDLVAGIDAAFAARGREMTPSNLHQADVPAGGQSIPNPLGTAPGLRCEIEGPDGAKRVMYAVPGVPHEMRRMVAEHVVPDLVGRDTRTAVIASRVLKTWGTAESALAERIAHRVEAQTNPTIAFLARGIEGLVVRLTAKASSDAEARVLLDAEEQELRSVLGELVFGVDQETMESVVLDACRARGFTLGVAESLTGGLVGARLASVPGASEVFRGTVAAYASDVKRSVLGVTATRVVSEECAIEMADGARRVLGADVGIAVTGVAGPAEQEGKPVGSVYFGVALPGSPTKAVEARVAASREMVRQLAAISLLNLLRLRLAALP